MGLKLNELLDDNLLSEMLGTGYVGVQKHPYYPLWIYNYTHKAQYDRVWNDVTRQCRGLIVHGDGSIIARPWPKFFNYGEHEEGTLDLDAEITARDKLDGSLGILYQLPPRREGGVCESVGCGGDLTPRYAIATRGSFTSEQATKATETLHNVMSLNSGFKPLPGITYLFEIIYPENRIVLDYGTEEKLVLLGVVDNETGETGHGDIIWPGEFAEFLHARTLREALELPPRENAEGIVVRFKDGDNLMLKIKQEDYVALHRIITGLNERVVWERLGNGETVEDICLGLPDEFAVWVSAVAVQLRAQMKEIDEEVHCVYNRIVDTGPDLEDWPGVREYRKYFAEKAQEHPGIRSYLFLLHDGKDILTAVWRNLKPAGVAPRSFDEDIA